MARRRYRLFLVCAAVFCFMLYRVYLNSWPDADYSNLHWPANHQAGGTTTDDSTSLDQNVPQPPPQGEQPVIPEEDRWSEKKPISNGEGPEKEKGASSGASSDSSSSEQIPKQELLEDGELAPQKPPSGVSTGRIDEEEAKRGHWVKAPENFPIKEEELITLPTGTPKQIPQIQFDFGTESEEAKTKRQSRQAKVKEEVERAWAGYKQFAWKHDELSPVSGRYRDPFCGWAATLVDSLDTLWITGLKAEFDEAVKAVAEIDFTYTPRPQIPVFETTIRYLGGLVAAFDVSGGHKGEHTVLLDKAVELAEILMGIFDTPNRMPLLYYNWKPEYTSQRHRAENVGIAELGTLSMEFTRLAQLTKKEKYYDAVARITNALADMQEAGTTIPGLFPEHIDASGCNRTATSQRDHDLSLKAQQQLAGTKVTEEPEGFGSKIEGSSEDKTGSAPISDDDRIQRRASGPPFGSDGTSSEWDCVPQGLVSNGGYETFHMGGSQDSAYEYFPKQYLLLGGLETKYKKLHEDTIDAINEWLMYSPMTDDTWDVLFPAKVHTNGDPKNDLSSTFEITHLTCFIGGMYGLGGKIFGRKEDIETAKKLTDGCVWAYQLTPSGLMPEGSEVIPCPTSEKCDFNETLWWEHLDSSKTTREKELAKWLKEHDEEADAVDPSEKQSSELRGGDGSKEKTEDGDSKPKSSIFNDDSLEEKTTKTTKTGEDEEGSKLPPSLKEKIEQGKDGSASPKDSDATTESDDTTKVEAKREVAADDASSEVPSVPEVRSQHPTRTQTHNTGDKPMSHKEYVQKKIKNDNLPPGFTAITSRSYILRPEAIESVWYMYRITGDPTWMEKGWKMFEATVKATRTEHANSAIDDVMKAEPHLKDEMESFWLAETLKYYYLLFSEPNVISLDEWVLNTEAHPFKRPT